MNAKPNSSQAALPRKPHADFPRYAHKCDRWAEQIRGPTRVRPSFSGRRQSIRLAGPRSKRLRAPKDDLLAGRTSRPAVDGLTHRELCNRFLAGKRTDLENRKALVAHVHWRPQNVRGAAGKFGRERLVTDLRPHDFEKRYKSLALREKLAEVISRPGNSDRIRAAEFARQIDAALAEGGAS